MTNKLRVLDLFSGIGGFSLGLERTGAFTTTQFCEIDQYCREVLKKHWPTVPIHDDVKTLSLKEGEVDVITGGFPCQDISLAGKGKGLSGERSGLVFEIIRLIKEGKPKFVILENSPALRSRGLETVLGALAEIGYDAEWHCIPAAHLGAPHRRDRVWIMAYPNSERGDGGRFWAKQAGWPQPAHGSNDVAYSSSTGLQGYTRYGENLRNSIKNRSASPQGVPCGEHAAPWWGLEPNVGRVVDGVPGRVHRLKQLGNAVVPQIPEAIGYALTMM